MTKVNVVSTTLMPLAGDPLGLTAAAGRQPSKPEATPAAVRKIRHPKLAVATFVLTAEVTARTPRWHPQQPAYQATNVVVDRTPRPVAVSTPLPPACRSLLLSSARATELIQPTPKKAATVVVKQEHSTR
jgi:hypothetical protein